MCGKDRRYIHDPQKEPCVPIERPCQHYPKAQQEAESWEEHIQDDGDQPTSDGGRTSPLRHQAHFRGVHAGSLVVIDDGGDLARMSVEGLTYQPGHSSEGDAIDGEDLIHGFHAGSPRLRKGLHQKAGAVGVNKRWPGAVGVEQAVKSGCSAGHVKKRGTQS